MASTPTFSSPTSPLIGQGRASTIRYTPDGHRIEVKLPSTTPDDEKRQKLEDPHSRHLFHWSFYTPENDKYDDEVLSHGDSKQQDEQNHEEEVTALLVESKEPSVSYLGSQKKAKIDVLPGTAAAVLDDKEGTTTTQSNGVEEGDTAG
ncbi:hypothetical protein PMIN03_000606 [Paraphaeosphaeria minitans]|uniref:Uncharacterized protein n=1 Tax=Paraphaeosphaeria minitans TaxID=565426 RepID=A0A9P6GVD3_9PLEO|nr:hypothetical protein PMIN01_00408 [Paraphaeosphaeria minitans]